MSRGFGAYFEFLAGIRQGRADAPKFGDHPDEARRAALGAGVEELRADLETAVTQGRIPARRGSQAVAMVGAGVEIGLHMVERDPPDVDAR